MMTTFRGWSLGCVVSGALLWSAAVQAQDVEGVVHLGGGAETGVVRISDQPRPVQVVRGQSIEAAEGVEVAAAETIDVTPTAHCEVEPGAPATGECPPVYVEECSEDPGFCWKAAAWIHNDIASKKAWLHAMCGPNQAKHARAGKGGRYHGPGRPLAGAYSVVYPVDPGYFDKRDGQVYAAPGYGGPVSVPLAPVVNSTYNYGWGVPSSRMTPVLHPATQAPVSQYPSPYPSAPVSY